jgi:hypothetical protein
MFIALITSSFAVAAVMLAWGTPGRYNRAQTALRNHDFALAQRRVR